MQINKHRTQRGIKMEKVKFEIKGYELKQMKMNPQGSIEVSFSPSAKKRIALILLDDPQRQ